MKSLVRSKGLIASSLVMMLLLAACTNSGGNTKDSSASPSTSPSASAPNAASSQETPLSNEPITLTVFLGNEADGFVNGIMDNELADAIKEKFNITLDIIHGDEVKQKTMIAGGDLPDIMEFEGNAYTLADSLIKSGQIIPLDDLIDKYGPNIKKYSQLSLDVFKKSYSNGTGNIYFLSTAQQKAYDGLISLNGYVNFYTRWDLYKDIGAPEMTNEDDFLNVMKQIQDKNPKTSDGKKVYSFSAWTDWGTWPYLITYPFVHGYTNTAYNRLLNLETGEVEDMYTDEDGIFWQGIKFFNKAYRMGLFDPEGFTQKLSQYLDKISRGELLNSGLNVFNGGPDLVKNTGNELAELIAIPGPFPTISGVYTSDKPLGWGIGTAKMITSSNKYPERTMQLLDYLNSPDGARLIFNGIQGVDWDIVDGKETLIGEMAKQDNQDYLNKTGFNHQLKELGAFDESYPNENGVPVDLKKLVNEATVTAAEKDFAKHYGAPLYPGQVYDQWVKDGKVNSPTKFWAAPSMVSAPSDTTTQALAKADQYFMANVTKFIMAKDDAAFETAKQKAIDDFIGMGLDKAYDEVRQLQEKAKITASELGVE
ncbi:type 2 periplasmic-binding domain-containing protein [Cohnella fermenti]|uniref:Extracellular solute-binding protein n=1 Tax=Cohnella fermenti TaxID=2565925 RepID=A0A4S4BKU5_9BACL|nr:hypothetical protein [Cohnella fermenti]THF74420.1 hypothetical protein E6C55_25600 [Cohnella fermenti]